MKTIFRVALAAALLLVALPPAEAADNLIGKMNDTAGTPFETFAYDIGPGTSGRRVYVLGHTLLDKTGAPLLTPANPGVFSLTGVVPLPTGAATDAKLEAVRALLASTLTVGLPSGAATDAKLEAVRALLAATLTVNLPSGAATAAAQAALNTSAASIDAKTPPITSGAVTQTCTALPAGTSTTFLLGNAARRSLRWQNVGTGAMTVAPGAGPVIVGAGLNYEPPASAGGQGGGTSFDGAPTPAGAFSAISTAGTTVCAWEGN